MGGDYMGEMIEGFARQTQTPRVDLWLDDGRTRLQVQWQEVTDTCARLVGERLRRGTNDPEGEKRLRRLVGVMLELKSLGLVE